MAVNLIELAKNYLSDDVVSQVSNLLGETDQNTQKALDGALPTILNGLVQKAAEPGGTSAIMDLVGEVITPNRAADEVITPDGGILSHLSKLFTDASQSSTLLSIGANIVKSLFGDTSGAVASAIASYSGVKQSSASSILNIAGPVLLSLISQKLTADGTGIAGADGLLSSQVSYAQNAIPSGLRSFLSAIPGFSLIGGLGGKIGDLLTPDTEPITRVTPPVADVPPTRPAPAPVYREEENRSSGNGWLPWLLLLLGAGALFFILRSCNSDTETSATTAESTTDTTLANMHDMADSADSSAGTAMDSAAIALKEATAKLGAFFKRKLPSGYELNIPENGIENNLVTFIEDKSRPVDKTTWFNFDRLLFDTGKATLRPESQEQLTNIAYILKEFPNVHIKLGGYTDNTGSAEVNKKLSQDRADNVMAELVKLGVEKARMEAEGYGPEHPIASNDTETGRAENRRIAIRVTQK
ncbi:OmpA family protein [Spirosoma sp.]|uniref:OmpA family protein n=1 Tax=Spirosoma sp. TaxID=1899569 RepID=UPI003B3AB74C